MRFVKTSLEGAYIIEIDKKEDERGFFARSFCAEELKQEGLNFSIAQCNLSYNHKKGTIRGMHYHQKPYEEGKIVSVSQGAIMDVIIDIRPSSPTYKKWESFALSSDNYKMLYISKGFAHGFQTLEDNTVVYYQMDSIYQPGVDTGILYNDSAFNIKWHDLPLTISQKDLSYLPFQP